MKILPLKDADPGLVVLVQYPLVPQGVLYPACVHHGAMNKLTDSGIWRCVTTYSKEKENACRAGFQQG